MIAGQYPMIDACVTDCQSTIRLKLHPGFHPLSLTGSVHNALHAHCHGCFGLFCCRLAAKGLQRARPMATPSPHRLLAAGVQDMIGVHKQSKSSGNSLHPCSRQPASAEWACPRMLCPPSTPTVDQGGIHQRSSQCMLEGVPCMFLLLQSTGDWWIWPSLTSKGSFQNIMRANRPSSCQQDPTPSLSNASARR